MTRLLRSGGGAKSLSFPPLAERVQAGGRTCDVGAAIPTGQASSVTAILAASAADWSPFAGRTGPASAFCACPNPHPSGIGPARQVIAYEKAAGVRLFGVVDEQSLTGQH
jgi:hypothetical protein